MSQLLALERQWHAAVEANVRRVSSSARLRHDPAQEELYDEMLLAAAGLDEAITQAGRERRDRIAQGETFRQRTSALLGVLALAAAAATRRVIDGHAQLEDGMRGPLTAEQRDGIVRIRRSARAMTGLIEDLLELARAESGQLTVKLDRVVLRGGCLGHRPHHRSGTRRAGARQPHL